MPTEQPRVLDPAPRLRRRVRSGGIVGLALTIAYALTVITDPPVTGFDAAHPWIALALLFGALTSARRTRDAPWGTPGGHLARSVPWLLVLASAVSTLVEHGAQDTLLLLVGIPTALVAGANAAVRVHLARLR